MPGPSRRGLLAQLATHLADDDPHLGSKLVRDATSGFKWWRQNTFPDTYLADPENGAQEGDRLTLGEEQ
jgi:hypothetical protein